LHIPYLEIGERVVSSYTLYLDNEKLVWSDILSIIWYVVMIIVDILDSYLRFQLQTCSTF